MPQQYNQYAHSLMPFGKFKGYYIKDIPRDYIEWAVVNITDRASAEMFAIELQRRNPKLRKK
tara:strand:+ start:382 stop:567 length:186 start_codon:yes stop_codon:yes gene_type:complete